MEEFAVESLKDLRSAWSKAWGKEINPRIGRKMLEESLAFKRWQDSGGIDIEAQRQLSDLVNAYKKNPASLKVKTRLKPGTRLVRLYQGNQHLVTVCANGFEYGGQTWKSLSVIANHITGSRWNGNVFFGLKG